MDFLRKKVQQLFEGQGGPAEGKRRGRSTALAVRPIPEDALILLPLRNAVLFPGVVSPITIGRPSSITAAQEAARSRLKLGFVLQRDPQVN